MLPFIIPLYFSFIFNAFFSHALPVDTSAKRQFDTPVVVPRDVSSAIALSPPIPPPPKTLTATVPASPTNSFASITSPLPEATLVSPAGIADTIESLASNGPLSFNAAGNSFSNPEASLVPGPVQIAARLASFTPEAVDPALIPPIVAAIPTITISSSAAPAVSVTPAPSAIPPDATPTSFAAPPATVTQRDVPSAIAFAPPIPPPVATVTVTSSAGPPPEASLLPAAVDIAIALESLAINGPFPTNSVGSPTNPQAALVPIAAELAVALASLAPDVVDPSVLSSIVSAIPTSSTATVVVTEAPPSVATPPSIAIPSFAAAPAPIAIPQLPQVANVASQAQSQSGGSPEAHPGLPPPLPPRRLLHRWATSSQRSSNPVPARRPRYSTGLEE